MKIVPYTNVLPISISRRSQNHPVFQLPTYLSKRIFKTTFLFPLLLITINCLGATPDFWHKESHNMSSAILWDTCRGTVTLEPYVDLVFDSMAYKWYYEDEVIPETSATIQVDEPGEYIVEISAVLNGYVQVTQQTFWVPEALQIEAVHIEDASCDENNGSLEIKANQAVDIFYSVDGSAFQEEPVFNNVAPGSYTLTIQNSFNCRDTQRVEVKPGSLPLIEKLEAFPASCGEKNGIIAFKVFGGTGQITAYLDSVSASKDNTFQNLAAGDYTINFVDEAGCQIASNLKVPGAECPLFIPNAFSPNGDGINDLFEIASKTTFKAQINTYSIFDRWGKQIYEANNFPIDSSDQWWDGTINHKTADSGTYIYLIEVGFANGEAVIFQGAVNILY